MKRSGKKTINNDQETINQQQSTTMTISNNTDYIYTRILHVICAALLRVFVYYIYLPRRLQFPSFLFYTSLYSARPHYKQSNRKDL